MGQALSSRGRSGKHAILRNNIADSDILRKFYPVLAASLQNGSGSRPGLPTELVIYIMRLADCVLLSMHTRTSTKRFVVHSASSEPHSQICLLTDPVPRRMLSHLAKMRLTTHSHDQGWCSDPASGSWTWFDISLVNTDVKGGLHIKTKQDGGSSGTAEPVGTTGIPISPLLSDSSESQRTIRVRSSLEGNTGSSQFHFLSWTSHRNCTGSSEFSIREGIEFGPDHEIWTHVCEGDRILVRALAQYPGWSNYVDWAALKIWEWYE